MEQAAQWIAPIATTIAAMMTAANGGARLTGYGFVAFAVGSIAWALYGLLTSQNNLLIQNAVLLVINIIGIWRWLGRTARYEQGAEAAADAADEPLVAATRLTTLPAYDREGEHLGSTIDAMLTCSSGRTAYVVLSTGGVGGVGEKLFAVPWSDIHLEEDRLSVDTLAARLAQAEGVDRDNWPAQAMPDWDEPVYD